MVYLQASTYEPVTRLLWGRIQAREMAGQQVIGFSQPTAEYEIFDWLGSGRIIGNAARGSRLVTLCQRRTGSEANDDIGWRGTIPLSHSKQVRKDEMRAQKFRMVRSPTDESI